MLGVLKWTFGLADFMVLLGKLAEEAILTGKGFLCGAAPVGRRRLSAKKDAMLWQWARDKMSAPWRQQGHKKFGNLDVKKLYELAKSR